MRINMGAMEPKYDSGGDHMVGLMMGPWMGHKYWDTKMGHKQGNLVGTLNEN